MYDVFRRIFRIKICLLILIVFFMAMKYVLYFSRSIRQADVNIINNKVGRQVYLVNNNNIAARYLAPEYSS